MGTTRTTRWAAALAVILGVSLAGCGGGSGGGGGSPSPNAVTGTHSATTDGNQPANPPAARAAITRAYNTLFSASASTADRVTALQNGEQYRALLQAQSSNPLAKQLSVKVTNIMFTGPSTAKVDYALVVGGQTIPRTGGAVSERGTWEVSDATFCQLLSLGGLAGSGTPCASVSPGGSPGASPGVSASS